MTKDTNYNALSKLFRYGGVFLILLSGISVLYHWYMLGTITINNLSDISIPLSFGIALFAIGISFESTDRMVSISNSIYLELKGVYEDKRLSLRKQRLKLVDMISRGEDTTRDFKLFKRDFITDYSFSIWKCLTYLQQAEALIKWINRGYQNKLINLLKNYYEELIAGRDLFSIRLIDEHKGHICQMYDIVSKFKAFKENNKRREDIESLLANLTT